MNLKWIAQRFHRQLDLCFRPAQGTSPNAAASAGSAAAVSIMSTPHAGRLEGASDRPEFEAIRFKTAPVAIYWKSATYRNVTWKE
jgi:hypothetical protein